MAGGYDCKFLSEPAVSLKCLICLSVAKDPRQHEGCGKLFCSECIEKYGTRKPCPNCKQTGTQFYKDNKSKREIDELKVKCYNKRKCEWVGTIGTLEKHVTTCKFTPLPCPRKCKGDRNTVRHFMRKDLTEHLLSSCPNRDYNCEYCDEKGTYASITRIHVDTCPKMPLPCPNGCNATIQRRNLERHVTSKCELALVSCKYERLGCDDMLRRKDIAAHEEDDDLHLRMAMDTTVTLERELNETMERVAELEDEIAELKVLKNGEPLTFKLMDYQMMRDEEDSVLSPFYYTSPQGYYVALQVETNEDYVAVFVTIAEGKYDTQLKWPLIGQVTFTLLNQLEDRNHYHDCLYLKPENNTQVGSTRGLDLMNDAELSYNRSKKTQYLKDDILYFRMSVKPTDYKPWLQ